MKKFKVHNYRKHTAKFCSYKCYWANKKGKKLSEKHKKRIGKSNKGGNKGSFKKGQYFSVKIRRKMSEAKQGNKNSFFGKHHTKEIRKIISEANKGKKNNNYIDGLGTSPYPSQFNSDLKLKIRKRDNYTCQNCGMTEEEHIIVIGQVLHVHHIDYNKQNCDEDNLITLCLWCNMRANKNREIWKESFRNKIGLITKIKGGFES